MNCLVLLVAFFMSTRCYQITVNTKDVNAKVTEFVRKYLNKSPITIISSEKTIDHRISSINITKRIVTDVNIFNKLLRRDEDFIFVEKTVVSFFETLLIFNKSSVWQSKSKFLVLIEKEKDTNNVTTIFRKLWLYKIYNVVVSLDFENFVTWYPYAKNNFCGNRTNVKMVKRRDPFKGKIPRKLENCDFNFITPLSPFKIYFDSATKKGIIPSFIDTIGEKLGLKINYVTLHDIEKDFEKNGNLNMTIYDLENYNVESAIYGAFNDIRLPGYQCEYTITVYQCILYLLCPPRKIIEPNLLLLFPPKVYEYFLTSLILIILSLKFIWKFKLEDAIMNTIKLIILGQIFPSNKKKFLLLTMLWYAFHIAVFYQTKLSSLLTLPRLEPKIKNIEQFLDTDYKFYLLPAIDLMLQARGQKTVDMLRKKKIPIERSTQGIELYLESPKHATFMISQVIPLVKNIEDMEIVYEDPKNHPLVYRMNDWILAIQEAGLYDKWMLQHSMDNEKYEAKYELKPNTSFKKLSVNNLYSVFIFLVAGLMVSVVVFLIEIEVRKKKQVCR